MTAPTPDRTHRALPALAIDLICVIMFAALGRRSHAEGMSITGIAETAWPFLTGTLVGWVISRGWKQPTAVVPTGVVAWICTVAVGMALRKATSAGTAFSFIVVASVVTAALLLGWRAARAALRS